METYSQNFLLNNGFTFILDRLPQTTFRIVSTDVPGIGVQPPSVGNPAATQYFPGSSVDFEPLTIEFLVDEDLKNYTELYNWITQQQYCSTYVPKDNRDKLLVSDGTLATLSNASNVRRVFYFKDLFPIGLGPLHFDTSITMSEPIQCTATFRYSYFELR
jgi:hypothetical protein